MNEKIKNLISFILGIVMMLSIVAMVMSLFIKFIVLNPNTYIKAFEKQAVQVDIKEGIEKNIGYSLTLNNLPLEIKEDIITEDDVKEEVSQLVTSIISYFNTGENNIIDINPDKYILNYRENMNKFLKDNSINITPKLKKELSGLESDSKQIITNELGLINLGAIKDSEAVGKIAQITSLFVSKLYVLSFVLPIICMLIVLAIWRNNYAKYMQWIGNGFLAAGLCIFLVFLSGYISHFYDHIIINTLYLKEYGASIIKGYLFTLTLWGLILICLGIGLLVPQVRYTIKRTKVRRRKL